MKIKEVTTRSIITKSNLPAADFVINPYIGCQHSCIYCYADFMKRFTGHSGENWGDFLDVKINAPETIDSSKIPKDSLILFGSVTDPYQPAEIKYEITKKCLEKLVDAPVKIEILTKSPLVLRDVELLKKFKNLRVGISIGIANEKFARELEPFVASPHERIDVLKKLKQNGIKTYLFISPIFPEISDIPFLLDALKGHVDEVLFENINIRANNQERILSFIKNNKPELENFYKTLPKNFSYWEKLKQQIIFECEKRKISYRIFFNHPGKKSLLKN